MSPFLLLNCGGISRSMFFSSTFNKLSKKRITEALYNILARLNMIVGIKYPCSLSINESELVFKKKGKFEIKDRVEHIIIPKINNLIRFK
ncbi:MAG: hypothetical protein ACFE9S_19430 [Candidatus Hermodarchaeota archaeon]